VVPFAAALLGAGLVTIIFARRRNAQFFSRFSSISQSHGVSPVKLQEEGSERFMLTLDSRDASHTSSSPMLHNSTSPMLRNQASTQNLSHTSTQELTHTLQNQSSAESLVHPTPLQDDHAPPSGVYGGNLGRADSGVAGVTSSPAPLSLSCVDPVATEPMCTPADLDHPDAPDLAWLSPSSAADPAKALALAREACGRWVKGVASPTMPALSSPKLLGPDQTPITPCDVSAENHGNALLPPIPAHRGFVLNNPVKGFVACPAQFDAAEEQRGADDDANATDVQAPLTPHGFQKRLLCDFPHDLDSALPGSAADQATL